MNTRTKLNVLIQTSQLTLADHLVAGGRWLMLRQSRLTPKTLKVNGSNYAYLEGGRGQTIILLHGFAADKDCWLRFARYLTHVYHVIAIDLPGHGQSSQALERHYGGEYQAQRVLEFVECLRLQPFHLLGNSMGGYIAVMFATRYPGKLKSLGLMNAGGIHSDIPSLTYQAFDRGENPLIVRDAEEFDKLVRLAMGRPPRIIPGFIKAHLINQYKSRQKINEKIFADLDYKKQDIRPCLRSIKIPSFILWGGKDNVIDVSCASVFAQHLPNASLAVLKNVGHIPMFEAPREAAAHYKKFLVGLDVR